MKTLLSRRDLICRDAVALMTDYLDGALPHRDRRRLERHLAGCPNCTEYLRQLRSTIMVAEHVDVEAIDPATQQSLIDLYRDWKRQHD
jgi:anti-sigma factor RsiW